MRKLSFVLPLMMGITMLAGCGGGGPRTLSIYQNKPEIDKELKVFAKIFDEQFEVETEVTSCGGSSCSLGTVLNAAFAAGEAPDIFVIDGLNGFEEYEEYILDVSNEEWVSDTDVAFKVGGKTYGFPVAVEGWGLAYNEDLIAEYNALSSKTMTINPLLLTNITYYTQVFQALDAAKVALGIDSVVAMAGGSLDMKWVTAHHNLNTLLAGGEEYGDMTITEDLLDGDVDDARLGQYANWVELLFDYADSTVLMTGGYDQQVGQFAQEKAVFIHQGNWIEPNLKTAGANFPRSYAPHGAFTTPTDGIFVAAPSWYVINKDSSNIQAAKDFLNFLAGSTAGHDYMVNKIGAIPAFKSVELEPTAPLSISVMEWVNAGKIYSWNQYAFSGEFRDNTLGPIYANFAKTLAGVSGGISKTQFIADMKAAFIANAA